MTQQDRNNSIRPKHEFDFKFGLMSEFHVPRSVAKEVVETYVNERSYVFESRWNAAKAPYEEAAVDRIVDLCNRSHRETMRLIEIEDAWSREPEEWTQANGCSLMETAQ